MECEWPAGQCCVISSLISESHSSGCPWDKFTLGGESGRVSQTQRGQEGSCLSQLPARCQEPSLPWAPHLNPLLSSLAPGIVFILQGGPKKSMVGVRREEMPVAVPPALQGIPAIPERSFGVYFPAGMWHGSLKRRRISIPGVSGLTAVGELSCSCSSTQL